MMSPNALLIHLMQNYETPSLFLTQADTSYVIKNAVSNTTQCTDRININMYIYLYLSYNNLSSINNIYAWSFWHTEDTLSRDSINNVWLCVLFR